MSAVEMDKVVNALIRAGRAEEALARVQATVDTDERVFSNTFIQVVLALAEAGENEKVIKVLSETAPGAFVNEKMRSNVMNIFYHYDRLGDDEKTSKIKEVLVTEEEVGDFLVQCYAQKEKEQNLAIVARGTLLSRGPQHSGRPVVPRFSSAVTTRDFYVSALARMERDR